MQTSKCHTSSPVNKVSEECHSRSVEAHEKVATKPQTAVKLDTKPDLPQGKLLNKVGNIPKLHIYNEPWYGDKVSKKVLKLMQA